MPKRAADNQSNQFDDLTDIDLVIKRSQLAYARDSVGGMPGPEVALIGQIDAELKKRGVKGA